MNPEWVAVFQSATAFLAPFWKAITWLGDEAFYLLVFPLVYWCLSPGLGLQTGLLLLFSAQMNEALKLAFHMPRPFWVSQAVRPGVQASGFGMPSGHTQHAVVVWGWLLRGWKPWGPWVAGLLAVLMGLSRVALGVHFWADVLVGGAFGLALLALYARFSGQWQTGLQGAGWGKVLTVAGGVALFWVAVAVLARFWSMEATPGSWGHAWSLKNLMTASGGWMGLVIGGFWAHRRGGFGVPASWRGKGLRALVGLVGVLLLWRGLAWVFPEGETVLALLARWVRYGLVGFWVAGGAPWLFQKMEATRSPSS